MVDGYGWMWMCVAGNVLKTGHYYYITTVTYFSCAKDANHSQMLGSPDPLVLSFPLKLIGADHGLHTSVGVQISCLVVILRLVVGLWSTLKDARGLKIHQALLQRVEPRCFD